MAATELGTGPAISRTVRLAGHGAAPSGGPSPSGPEFGAVGRDRPVPSGAALRPATPQAYPARPGPAQREQAGAHAGGRPGGVSIEIGRVEIRTAAPTRAPAPPGARLPRSHVIDPGPGFTGGW